MTRFCRVCERVTRQGRQRCDRCAQYLHHHGTERPRALDRRGHARKCRLADCPRVERLLARGLCHKHYLAAWRLFADVWRARRAYRAQQAAQWATPQYLRMEAG